MGKHFCPGYDEVTAMTTMLSQFRASKRSTVRKKFSKPPVKLACLSWSEHHEYDVMDRNYAQTKRGRSRKSNLPSLSKKRATQASTSDSMGTPPIILDERRSSSSDRSSMTGPLPFQSEIQTIFADLFDPNDSSSWDIMGVTSPSPSATSSPSVVRIYGSEHEILDAYYLFIHPYFPILPPRVTSPFQDCPLGCGVFDNAMAFDLPYRARSPLGLAVSSILALVPHPEDPEPASETSMALRRTYSHTFAQMANLSIEADCERDALNKSPLNDRPLFHPHLPIELEKILALLVLSIYEYTQRGNLPKMRYRTGQAMTMALDMSLHAQGEENGRYTEARRRAWWMTYYCVLQGSIVSESSPSIGVNDTDFVTPYPQFSADPDGWSILIQAQQALALADQFTVDLNRCLSTGSNIPYMYHRMKGLDDTINTMLSQSQMLPVTSPCLEGGDKSECATALGIRAVSRIKLFSAQIKVHQSQAFLDNPIFSRRQYEVSAYPTPPGTACATLHCQDAMCQMEYFSGDAIPSNVSSPVWSPWTPSPVYRERPPTPPSSVQTELPFSVKHSAKVCLRAALAMSYMFQLLPNPNSIYALADGNFGRGPQSVQSNAINHFPLAMPSFACCLAQGSYIMSTICYKARMARRVAPELNSGACSTHSASDQLVEELRKGMECIIAAVGNHAVAFEAMRGIRDEIESAYYKAFPEI
ncbi:hypothetical protein FE257_012962 [Aspergillus nanangensis]|uniref:Xylanolytic transcriptional activator regulatory domain-containing protein n=1 Tax=Aspergillus nanangensis TaxID=2582783 RepID=A0AAD4CF81_ASPNN|nr:hypothetical protein FE257_012962 [Aspergillus nanangensis]